MSTSRLDLDKFTIAYLEAALWSSTDNSNETGGEPLDANYSIGDFAPEALERAREDCAKFKLEHAQDVYGANYQPGSGEWSNTQRAGHDFWLTRNGHGTGFWDRGLGEIGERLTAASEAYGECYLYVGDDGLLYFA